MDHGAAHERIEELLLEPARLADLGRSTASEDVALREHLAACAACRADLDGWRRIQASLHAQLRPGAGETADEVRAAVLPVAPPAALRAAVLDALPSPGDELDVGPARVLGRAVEWRRTRAPWVGLAAALALLVGFGALTLDQGARRATAEADARALGSALAAVDRILAAENHKVVPMTTTTGAPAGTISWSRHDWVVLTNALATPTSTEIYLCWLEEDGKSVAVGQMEFAGATAYWAASVDEWATWEINEDTLFVVTREPAGAQARSGPVVLQASLGS